MKIKTIQNHQSISYLFVIFIVLLLAACGSPEQTSNQDQARILISLNDSPTSRNMARGLHEDIPQNISSILIRVWRAGQLLNSNDILPNNGQASILVPTGVKLTVTGTAYADEEIVFLGESEVNPLSAGDNATVSLHLLDFGISARGASQVDIVSGVSGNGKSTAAFFFGGSDYVLFRSSADNLGDASSNFNNNLFVKEIAVADNIVNVHTNNDGEGGNGLVGTAGINTSGEFVVFSSDADNLLGSGMDNNRVSDVFLKDLPANKTTRISEIMGGTESSQRSFEPSISGDGEFVVFVSEEALLLDDRTGIFRLNRKTNELTYIGEGRMPVISGNGQFAIAWEEGNQQLVRYTLGENVEKTILVSPYQVSEDKDRIPYAIDQKGEKIIYALEQETAQKLAATSMSRAAIADNTITSDIYLYDFTAIGERKRLLSLSQTGLPVEALHNSINPGISENAEFVVFSNGLTIYVKSTINNALSVLSVKGRLPSLSKDGQKIAFTANNDKLYTVNNPLFNDQSSKPINGSSILTISFEGNGRGEVSSESENILCGEVCEFDYPQGSLIQLTAKPDEGEIFEGWGASCEIFGQSLTINFSINSSMTCSAKFIATKASLLLTVNGGSGGGYITSDDESQTLKQSDCDVKVDETTICQANFPIGDTVTLQPVPTGNIDEIKWQGCDLDNGIEGCVVTLNEARDIVATFSASDFQLAVSKLGAGSGTIKSDGLTIDCGSVCDADFQNKTEVILTAQADANAEFTGWSGTYKNCSGKSKSVSLVMDKTGQCSASFELKKYDLKISTSGDGTGHVVSEPSGINCGDTCGSKFTYGTTISLEAIPGDNGNFIGWGGSCSGEGVTTTVLIDKSKECSAKFEILQNGLSVKHLGDGFGKVSSVPAGILCGSDCGEAYDIGTSVTLLATPDNNSVFSGWSGSCNSEQESVKTIIDAPQLCKAKFDLKRPLLVVKVAGSGVISSLPVGIDCGNDCEANFAYDTQIKLSAVAKVGSIFEAWSGACSGNSAETLVTLTNASNCKATFILKEFDLTITTAGAGTVTSDPVGLDCGEACVETYPYLADIQLTARPSDNSYFVGWTGHCNGEDLSTNIIVDETKKCHAEFKIIQKGLSVKLLGTGFGQVASEPVGINCNPDCSEPFDIGTNVSLLATPEENSVFAGWSDACESESNSVSLILDNPKVCRAKFDLKRPQLTVDIDGAGQVISQPTGIDCGSDCEEKFDYNTTVTLNATPATGSDFLNWTGACSGSDVKAIVTLKNASFCKANFTLQKKKLSISITGSGSVTNDLGNINCNSDCEEIFDYNTLISLTATPTSNSYFVGWGGSCHGDQSKTTITLTSDSQCDAKFAVKQIELTVKSTGSGSITSIPAGLDCSNECTNTYDYNTSVALLATPANNYRFTGWAGDCSGTNPKATIILTSQSNCEAKFSLNQLTLTVKTTGAGTIVSEPGGIDCGTHCSNDYAYNTKVTLIATPAISSQFTGWAGNCSGSDPKVSLTLTSASNCEAKFSIKKIKLSVKTTGSGTIVSDPSGLNCKTACTQNFDYNTAVTLVATPSNNNEFAGWSGSCSGTNPKVSITLTSASNCEAKFSIKQIKLSVKSTGSGTIVSDPSGLNCKTACAQNFDYNTVVTLVATPSSNNEFTGWSGNCSGTNPKVSLTLKSGSSCEAKFAVKQINLSVKTIGSGSGTVTSDPNGIDCGSHCNSNFKYNSTVTLLAAPSNSSKFVGWTGNCSGTNSKISLTLKSASSCEAKFAIKQINLTVKTSGSGTIRSDYERINCESTCTKKFDYNTTVTLVAKPFSNKEFTGWAGNCSGSNPEVSINLKSSSTCEAKFATKQVRFSIVVTGNGSVKNELLGTCDTKCSGDFNIGTKTTLFASASKDSVFVQWQGENCLNGKSTKDITLNTTTSCEAVFRIRSPQLSIKFSGTGEGLVYTNARGDLYCVKDCSKNYAYGEKVVLFATALTTSTFQGWNGSCSGLKTPITITMDAAKTCTAKFTLNNIAASTTGSGKVTARISFLGLSIEVLNCGTNCSTLLTDGTDVLFEAIANPGFGFSSWSGGCSGKGVKTKLKAGSSLQTCTANFLYIVQ